LLNKAWSAKVGPGPVFLFDLTLVADGEWKDISPHTCGGDIYFARLSVRERPVLVHWSIRGPRKDEFIAYVYQ
jgi:hypothetical protein